MDLPHNSRGPQLLATYLTLFPLVSIVIALRFYTRVRITHFVGADDWWILATYIVAVLQLALWLTSLHFGNARHIWDLPENDPSTFFLLVWLTEAFYFLSIGMIKMSSLALYLRIFPSENFKAVVRCIMALIVAMTIAIVISGIFQCLPVGSGWEIAKWVSAKCINRTAQQYTGSALTFSTDILILLLPIKYIIKLPISLRERAQAIALMSLGVFTCIASVVRFTYIYVVGLNSDPTWNSYNLSLWTAIEFNLGMIATSMPAVKPLWTKYLTCTSKNKEEPQFILEQSQFRSIGLSSGEGEHACP